MKDIFSYFSKRKTVDRLAICNSLPKQSLKSKKYNLKTEIEVNKINFYGIQT